MLQADRDRAHPSARAALLLVVLTAVLSCTSGGEAPGNLLRGRQPLEARSITNPERIVDGVTPREGDAWRSDLSAELRGRSARLQLDLGAVQSIDALVIVADNNDLFDIAISEDGKRWKPLWDVPSVPQPGMRTRSIDGLAARGRYLRVSARGADAFVSIGELLAFSRAPQPFPPKLARTSSGSQYSAEQRWLAGLGVVLALVMLSCFLRVPLAVHAAFLGLGAYALFSAYTRFSPLWPFHEEIVSAFRTVLASLAVVGLCIARARLSSGEPLARARSITALLSVVAVLAVATFYNFGRPWFLDFTKGGRPTPVHSYDMRVYYPVAKYFDELHFDGLYFASVAAYLEGTGQAPASVSDTLLRDLRTNHLVFARDVMPEIERVHERFSPARWQSFKEDMRYFWTSMSREHYLGTLRDHGGNATPAWLAIAHLLFAHTHASEATLTKTALFDPLFVLLIFVCVWRSFDRYTALACLIVFGATDFPMLGSNWAGSTLRFDWMAGLGLAACAFKTKRPLLGGALLGYATMMRAFPLLSIALLGGGAVADLALTYHRERSLPSWSELRVRYRAQLRALQGAALVMAALFALSSALFGMREAWGDWAQKIALHNEKSNSNHVGLRTVMSFDPKLAARKLPSVPGPEPWMKWHEAQASTFAARKPLFWIAALGFVLAAMWACAGVALERAVVLGLLLVPVLSYPANYYMHAIYLLPILASGLSLARTLLLELVIFALCFAQFFTLGPPWGGDERFFFQSVLLLSATVLIIALLAWQRARERSS